MYLQRGSGKLRAAYIASKVSADHMAYHRLITQTEVDLRCANIVLQAMLYADFRIPSSVNRCQHGLAVVSTPISEHCSHDEGHREWYK